MDDYRLTAFCPAFCPASFPPSDTRIRPLCGKRRGVQAKSLNSELICRRRISPILPNEHPFPYRLAHEVTSSVKHKTTRDSYLRLVIDTGLKCRSPLRQPTRARSEVSVLIRCFGKGAGCKDQAQCSDGHKVNTGKAWTNGTDPSSGSNTNDNSIMCGEGRCRGTECASTGEGSMESDSCKLCDAGTFVSGTVNAKCTTCADGKYKTSSMDLCKFIEAGKKCATHIGTGMPNATTTGCITVDDCLVNTWSPNKRNRRFCRAAKMWWSKIPQRA